MLAGAAVKGVVAPFERVTVPLLSCREAARLGAYGVFREVHRLEGWRGFFKGAVLDLARGGAARGATVGLADGLAQALGAPHSVAGALIGAGQTLVLHPLEVVQTVRRASVGPGAGAALPEGAVRTLRLLALRGGLRGLYPALSPSLVGFSAFYALQLGTRRPIQDATGSPFVGGFAATVLACSLCNWNNVVRLTMQRRAVDGTLEQQGWAQTLVGEYRAGGVRRFYVGFGLKVVQTGATMGLTITLYEKLRSRRRQGST